MVRRHTGHPRDHHSRNHHGGGHYRAHRAPAKKPIETEIETETEAETITASAKHPEIVVIDHSQPEQRVKGWKVISDHQRDLYFGYDEAEARSGNPIGIELVRGRIAAAQIADKKTIKKEIGSIYFPVDGIDVRTAGKAPDKQNIDDAPAYLESLVDLMVQAGGKGQVVGHASYTAHDKVDIIKDAQGNITKIPHNDYLGNNRALNTQQMMDAIYKRKYPELAKKDPSLFSAAALAVEGRGDRDLAVKTNKEHHKNRSATIEMEYQVVDESTLKYVMIHADPSYLNAIYERRMDKRHPQDIPFDIDLGMQTDLGKFLQNNSKIKGLVPSKASFLLNPADYTKFDKPVRMNVSAAEADDFRVLVSEGAGRVSYAMNRDGSASIRVNGKPIINLYIQTPEGPAKPQDILVATIGKEEKNASGRDVAHTKPVARDVKWEARRDEAIARFHKEQEEKATLERVEKEKAALALKKEQEAKAAQEVIAREREVAAKEIAKQEQIEIRKKISHEMDKTHDGQISYEELVAYRKELINPMGTLGADGRTSLTAEDVVRKVRMYAERNPEQAERFVTMLAQIGHVHDPQNTSVSVKNIIDNKVQITVSTEQMTAAVHKRDTFKAMLTEGKFEIPKSGMLAVAEVYDKTADKSPTRTADRPVASNSPPASPYR